MLYDLSYANLTLYGASLPSYRSPKDKKGGGGNETINGDDPERQAEIDKLFDEESRNR